MGFPKDFLWGSATASAQIEGGWDKNGRTPSVWDVLPDGKIKNGDTPRDGCDHYGHWQEDVEIIKQLGLKAYRFSISWSRVIPRHGEIDPKGLQFYIDLVDALVNAGVEPMVTLFHWDLPVWAAELGGWDSKEFPDIFEEYAKVVVDALSDKVKYWFTFNEPQCFVTNVTNEGWEHDEKRSTRNVMLAHGKAVQVIRKHARLPPQVGIAIMGMCMEPVQKIADEAAVKELTFSTGMLGIMGMGWWLDPIILGQIPAPLKDTLSEEDISVICQPLDFFAGNVYFSVNYYLRPDHKNPLVFPGMPRSTASHPVTPACLYWFPKFCWERYKLPVIITENGFSNTDFVMIDGRVHDPQREDYIHRYLLELKKAIDDGVPVLGYLYWSLLDNFEWNEGFDIRYGLVYVDYQTKKRTVKDSAHFYAKVIETNGECL